MRSRTSGLRRLANWFPKALLGRTRTETGNRRPGGVRLHLTDLERRDLLASTGPTIGYATEPELNEGSWAYLTIQVFSGTYSSRPADISYDYALVDGPTTPTATGGTDYTSTAGLSGHKVVEPVQLSGGSWSYPEFELIELSALGDTVTEGDEFFTLQFSNFSGATLAAGYTPTWEVRIKDAILPTIGYYAPATIDEGGTGQVLIWVNSPNNYPNPQPSITFDYALVDGPATPAATNGVDYTSTAGLSGTITLSTYYTGSGYSYGGAVIDLSALGDAVAEGDEYFTVQFSHFTNAVPVNPSAATVQIHDIVLPPPPPPPVVSDIPFFSIDLPCPLVDVVASDPAGGGPRPRAYTDHPVRYADGVVAYAADDLAGGVGVPWGLQRTWTNGAGYAVHPDLGAGWTASQMPALVQQTSVSDDIIIAVSNGTTGRFYDRTGTTYASRLSDTSVLSHDTTAQTFTLTDAAGARITFYDFSTTRPAGQRGRFASYVAPGGSTVAVYSSNTAGQPTEVRQTGTTGGVTATDRYVYAYTTAGLVSSVTLSRQVGSGAWATVRSVGYSYYDGTTAHGNAGDLKTATVSATPGGTPISTDYYRYYKPGQPGGYAGGLKYVVSGPGYDRAVADLGYLDSVSDAQLALYAAHYFEYDANQRVTKEVAGGLGCSSCSSGLGAFTYTYTTSTNPDGTNSWRTRTDETLPDGTTRRVYTNAYAQVMLTETTTTGGIWREFYRYDAAGRVVLAAAPSAVTGYNDSYADLVVYMGGNAAYLRDAEGLVATYAYAAGTTATTDSSGDAAGRLKATAVRRGEFGTSVPQSAAAYVKRTAGGVDLFFPAAETVYRNADGTGGLTATTAYTWHGSTAQPAAVTVTLPAVTTAQNGPGTATTYATAYDPTGRPVWFKDGAGFLAYTGYDPGTGAAVKAIADVDTARTGDFTGLPAGWATPAGGGLHLVTTAEVDLLGRTTRLSLPNGRVDYTTYNDVAHEVRSYLGWTGIGPTGPTVVARADWGRGYTENLTMSAGPVVSGGRPTGTEAVSGVRSLSRAYTNPAGQVTHTDAYFNLTGLTYTSAAALGFPNTHYYRTKYGYDAAGRPSRTESPTGTIYRTVYDGLGRAVSKWVGTDDTPDTGYWSPTNTYKTDLVQVRGYEYDGGGVGDGNLTKLTEYPGLGAAARVTLFSYDWRDRVVAVKQGVESSEAEAVNRPLTYLDLDNLGRATKTRVYDGDGVTLTSTNGVPNAPAAGRLRTQAVTRYDELGRVYRSEMSSVDPVTGAVGTYPLTSDVWYDARGQVVKTASPGGLVQKSAYDGVGRVTATYLTDGGGDTGYADATGVAGDTVLEQAGFTYDAAGNVLTAVARQRFHDATGAGPLGTPTSGVNARVSYVGYYYDPADRPVAVADVGTNGGAAWTRPGTVPARSDTVLVSSTTYDTAGRVYETTDPAGRVARTEHDALGRPTKTIAHYVDGVVSDADDTTTEYAYNAAGMTSLTARATGGGGQTTEWVYGGVSGGSGLYSNDIVGATRWPDATTGAATAAEQETVRVNALGQPVSRTDRNGTTHTLTYDVLGRVTADAATTLGAGVDGAVRRIEAAYDGQGNAFRVTSYNAAAGGSVVNQVERAFNGFGQLVTEYQEHAGVVSATFSPRVQYAYSEAAGGANHSRPTTVTYPSGYQLGYDYNSGLDQTISRLSSLSDGTGVVEGYQYLGAGTVVARQHPQPGIDLTYVKLATEPTGDAGDQYTGLDRFGRVIDQRWQVTGSSTSTDRFRYGYDRVGNRTYRDNLVNPAFGEVYGYDGRDQLTSFDRGTLNGTKTGLAGAAARTQAWDYDAQGNWDAVTTDGATQTRAANRQNEITTIGGAIVPAYDAAGNMTRDETGRQFVYDAWDRLARVTDGVGVTVREYRYDGLGRRTAEVGGPAAPTGPERVSVSTAGAEGKGSSGTEWDGVNSRAAISADGRYVAFTSDAWNLVPGDTNGSPDVFVRDRVTNQTTRVSVMSGGGQGSGGSLTPSLSADGRFVAFTSATDGLVAGDANNAWDIAVHDRATGETTLASVATDGTPGNDYSHWASISADGRYVAFYSAATNLVPGDTNGVQDIFVRDRVAGTTTRASVGPGGAQADGHSQLPSISADGRYVAYHSYATNLVGAGADVNGQADVYVWDRVTGTTTRASVSGSGGQTWGEGLYPSISGDGRFVAFTATADDLGAGDGNGGWDVVVRDRVRGTTEVASVATDGTPGNSYSHRASISADGRYVAFYSAATTLAPGAGGGVHDVFVRDRVAGTTTRVGAGNGLTELPAVSADGRYVAARSSSNDLVGGDGNGQVDVFAWGAYAAGETRELYYSAGWQVVEERAASGQTVERNVWSPVYVDALVVRTRDTDGNGTLDERLWVQQDANWNVTAVADDAGTVVERYAYDPFGVRTVLDANWGVDVDGVSDYAVRNGHQGLRYDPSAGLYHNRMRDYSATLGRFTSTDPIGFAAGDTNLYRYEGNGPITSLDPSGLDDRPWTERVLGLGDYIPPISGAGIVVQLVRGESARTEQIGRVTRSVVAGNPEQAGRQTLAFGLGAADTIGTPPVARLFGPSPLQQAAERLDRGSAVLGTYYGDGLLAAESVVTLNPGLPTKVPSRLFGHNEYVVVDSAHAAKVRQGLEAYYKQRAPRGATIKWVDNVPGGRNGYFDTVTGEIRLSTELLAPQYRHLAEGVLIEELQHFHQVQSRGWFGRKLTSTENMLLEKEVVQRIQRSGFKIFDSRCR